MSPILYYIEFNKFYTLRSLPPFLISVILALVLACQGSVQNLSCDPEQSKGFSPRRVAEATRQAGMTLKTNIQFQTPCGLCRRVFTCLDMTDISIIKFQQGLISYLEI